MHLRKSIPLIPILLAAILRAATPPASPPPAPPATAPDLMPIESFLDEIPPDDLLHSRSDPNASLRTNLFTKWVHAHRTGKPLQATATYVSAGSADKSGFTASLFGVAPLFDFYVSAVLPDSDTDKALTITKNQRVTVTGTIDAVSYSIGTYGPELHLKLTHASLTDLAPPPPTLGPIGTRNAAAKIRLTDAALIDNDKQKDEITKMAASAAKADADLNAFLQKNTPDLDPASATSLAHGYPYPGMPTDLLFLTGKTIQTRDDSKSSGVEIKTILFATFGYSDDAFLLTLKSDTVNSIKKVPIPDAKYYATPADLPPPPKQKIPTKTFHPQK